MEEWKEYKYTDLCTLIGGGTPKTSEPSYWGGSIPWLSVKDFGNDDKYVYTTEKTITEAGLNNSSTKLLNKEDIIISARGTIGAIAMLASEMAFNQSCFGIRSNHLSDQHFLYYLTKTKIHELQKSSHGSVFDTITRDTFEKIDCLIPSIQTQQEIASILSSLDDKIEVNRKICENLEQQAQALFKSWFVDFEPFKNGEFVESELGMIPKGWRVDVLSSFGNIVCGKTPSKAESSYYGGSIPFIKIPDMHNKVFVAHSEDNLSRLGDESQIIKRLPPYSILVSCIATVGLVCMNTKEAHTNQQINSIIPQNHIYRYYLYEKICSIKDFLINLGRGGTTTLNVNTKTFSNIKILKPQDDILLKYDRLVQPLFNKIESLCNESSRLASLRDTLLPKLMSGELRVGDVGR